MTSDLNAEKPVSHWEEETNRNGEHFFKLRRGNEEIGGIIMKEAVVFKTPTLLLTGFHIRRGYRGNPGIITKLIKEIKKCATSAHLNSVSWLTTWDMTPFTDRLKKAGLVHENEYYDTMPIENVDEKIIFTLLKTQKENPRQSDV